MRPLSPLDLTETAFRTVADAAKRTGLAPARFEAMTEASLDVGQTPSEVVYEENKLRLLHYEPRTDEQYDVPVLLVYALINRPYVLDVPESARGTLAGRRRVVPRTLSGLGSETASGRRVERSPGRPSVSQTSRVPSRRTSPRLRRVSITG